MEEILLIDYLINEEVLQIKCPYKMKNNISCVEGAMWSHADKSWIIPLTIESVQSLQLQKIRIPDTAYRKYQELRNEKREIEEQQESGIPIQDMPINKKAYSYQIQGYNKAYKLLDL